MVENEIRSWKKVYEGDLTYISYELKETIDTPAMIVLEGQLGSGKTTFSKVFMDNSENTMSPSYSIVYEAGNILHADLYRIKDYEELIQLELPLYLEDKKYFLVEWGKKYIHSLFKQIPENFSVYLLEINVNESNAQTENSMDDEQTRNFTLYELKQW